MNHSLQHDMKMAVKNVIAAGKESSMRNKELAVRLAGKVPPEHRERFQRELGEHLLHTFLHANVVIGGGLALAAGTIGEKAVDAATAVTPDVWGLGWLHNWLQGVSESPVVENLPEGLCALAVFIAAAGNYLEYRRFQRSLRREVKRFACGFLASIDDGPANAGVAQMQTCRQGKSEVGNS